MPNFVDDKSPLVIPFILDRIAEHTRKSDAPFFIGLNGVQGVGKTTLVTALESTLSESPHSLPTLTLSIDDLYLPYHAQQQLAQNHPRNPLIQHRGQPSTHDLPLALSLFHRLRHRQSDIRIPAYDKSAHEGRGDRVPEGEWKVVNREGVEGKSVKVVVFEGWCVGFRPLEDDELEKKWREAVEEAKREDDNYQGRLGRQRLEDVFFVNQALKGYNGLTNHLDAFVHIDAEDTLYVYPWRLEQEAAMRSSRGTGMTDPQVIDFVNGYYPAYELFTSTLRRGIFPEHPGRQLRLVVGRDRKVVSSEVI